MPRASESNEMAKGSFSWPSLVACFVLGGILASSALYVAIIQPGEVITALPAERLSEIIAATNKFINP